MTTYCILGTGGVVETTFGVSQLPTTQTGYTEIAVSGGQVGQIWNGTAFVAGPAPVATQVAAAIEAGLTVSSTSAPTINGTYAVDPSTQSEVAALVLAIQVNDSFPDSMTAYPWPLMNGSFVSFPSTTAFKDWATAISNYVAALDLYAASAPGSALPASSVTIA